MSTIVLTIKDHGRSLRVKVADIIAIRLEENPTTGYLWEFESPPEGVVRLERSEFRPARGGAIGAAGQREVVLVVLDKGTWRLRMFLRRPWDASDRIDTMEISIISS